LRGRQEGKNSTKTKKKKGLTKVLTTRSPMGQKMRYPRDTRRTISALSVDRIGPTTLKSVSSYKIRLLGTEAIVDISLNKNPNPFLKEPSVRRSMQLPERLQKRYSRFICCSTGMQG